MAPSCFFGSYAAVAGPHKLLLESFSRILFNYFSFIQQGDIKLMKSDTVKTFLMLLKVIVSNKCSTFQKNVFHKHKNVFHSFMQHNCSTLIIIINVFSAPN